MTVDTSPRPAHGAEALEVAVTGASGMIGGAVVDRLLRDGHRVRRLVRRAARTPDEVWWDPGAGKVDMAGLRGVDAAVHLAGETVAERWTGKNKERIEQSRVGGTHTLARALAALEPRPRVLITASAVGVYGANRGDEVLTEDSSFGDDFLARVGRRWEEATAPAAEAGIRVVNLRFGIVLGRDGGALGRMLLPFRLGLGGRIGDGRQWMSWIALEDVVRLVLRALTDPALEGPLNTVGGAVRNRDFTAALGRVLHRPAVLPVPPLALKLVYGREMVDGTLLASQRVVAKRLGELGHPFLHTDVEQALRAELGG
jgi:uncharacterized protein (TIGR01777 family)